MNIFLSDLEASGSLSPGVSMSVMSPNDPALTHEVTDLNEAILLKFKVCSAPLKYFSE